MASVIRLTLRTEIERSRENFHRFLLTIPPDALIYPSKDPIWTNGELLYRMSTAPRVIIFILSKNADQDLNHRSSSRKFIPGFLLKHLNARSIRTRARNSTRWSIGREYDETCTLVLEMLDRIPDDGFEKKLGISANDPLLPSHMTVEQLFHYVLNHFETHRKQINLGM